MSIYRYYFNLKIVKYGICLFKKLFFYMHNFIIFIGIMIYC